MLKMFSTIITFTFFQGGFIFTVFSGFASGFWECFLIEKRLQAGTKLAFWR